MTRASFPEYDAECSELQSQNVLHQRSLTPLSALIFFKSDMLWILVFILDAMLLYGVESMMRSYIEMLALNKTARLAYFLK